MLAENNTIDFFSAVKSFTDQDTTFQQNTHDVLKEDTSLKKSFNNNLLKFNTLPKLDIEKIDSILKKSEEREKQLKDTQILIKKPVYIRKTDTTEILYKQFGIAGFPIKQKLKKDLFNQNILYNIPVVKPFIKQNQQSVFVENEVYTQTKITHTTTKTENIKPQYLNKKVQFDWVTILLIASLLLIGWVRLFNKKYLISLIKSTVLYKESNNLFRERNSLMEKASFLMNLLFINNISIFFLQIKNHYNFEAGGLENHILYFIIFSSFVGFFIFRYIAASFIGYTFLKQKILAEYILNVNIYTKNIGLILFPVIIILQFLPYSNPELIIYLGIILIAVLYLFQVIRSFQLFIYKNLSIFFLILYLCALEITPILVIYKTLLTHL